MSNGGTSRALVPILRKDAGTGRDPWAPDADLGVGQNARFAPRVGRQMRLDLRKLRFRQPKLVATHLCLLFGSRESRHYARANIFMSPDPKVRGFVALVKKNPAGVTG